jgi:hypothetical protein
MTLNCKIKGMPCSPDNGIELHQGVFVVVCGNSRCGGSVDDVRERTARETVISDIAGMKLDGRIYGKMRRLFFEHITIPCKDKYRRIKLEFFVRPGKTLKEPVAEKTGAAGYEQTFPPEIFPKAFCMGNNVIQIMGEGVAR